MALSGTFPCLSTANALAPRLVAVTRRADRSRVARVDAFSARSHVMGVINLGRVADATRSTILALVPVSLENFIANLAPSSRSRCPTARCAWTVPGSCH